MAPLAVLKITADDPAAPLDFEHFCDTGGHQLLSSTEQAGIFTFVIAKSAG
jgi:tRNA 2-thiouridine synthesizing protein A